MPAAGARSIVSASMSTTGNNTHNNRRRLPDWLKRPLSAGPGLDRVAGLLKDLHLNTVCDGALCPNRGECFSSGTATFMILGDRCTRNCAFCAVPHGVQEQPDAEEPGRLARAVELLKLKHVVITSVTRDDLPDGGAGQFAACIRELKKRLPSTTVEVLIPDFRGDTGLLNIVLEADPEVLNHNLETTRRLTAEIRSGADYERSLSVLRHAADSDRRPVVKSGFMLGLGEKDEEIGELLGDLLGAGVHALTVGQYLRPSRDHREVSRYYTPEEFESLGQRALNLGFLSVASAPFVRSSYRAERMYAECLDKRAGGGE